MLSRLIQIPAVAGKEHTMYIAPSEKIVSVLAILFARRVTENTALYAFIGSNESGQGNPAVYIGIVGRTKDSFLFVQEYTSMDLEEFQDGDEGPVFSNDYLTAWIEKKGNRIYEISIIEASKVFEGEECHVDTYDINLPNNYFGCFPF